MQARSPRHAEAIRLINLARGMIDDKASVAAVHMELAIDALSEQELQDSAEVATPGRVLRRG